MTDWDELFRKSHFPLEEPQRQPAVLCDFLRDSDVRRIYDLGCSLGQNLMFLAERGFELYGTDLSETALMRAREKADGMKLRVELVKADMKSVLFIGSLFDAVICIYAIYHNPLNEMRRTTSEISRVLRPGGFTLVTFLRTRSCRHGKGIQIESNTSV